MRRKMRQPQNNRNSVSDFLAEGGGQQFYEVASSVRPGRRPPTDQEFIDYKKSLETTKNPMKKNLTRDNHAKAKP